MIKIKKRYLVAAALVLFGIILAFSLFLSVDISKTSAALSTLDLTLVALSFIIYLAVYFLRALRFYILMHKKISFKSIFIVTCIHNFLNTALPSRIGELSYPVLMKKWLSVRGVESLSNLILSRILDGLGIISIFLLAFSCYVFGSVWFFLFAPLTVLSFACTFLFLSRVNVIFWPFLIFRKTFKSDRAKRIFRYIEQIKSLSKEYSSKERIKLVVFSLALNFLMFLVGYVLLLAVGVNIPIVEGFVGGALSSISVILPIQGFFNIGTLEVGWIFGYGYVGVGFDQAVISGFVYHAINIIFISILFLAASGLAVINRYFVKR